LRLNKKNNTLVQAIWAFMPSSLPTIVFFHVLTAFYLVLIFIFAIFISVRVIAAISHVIFSFNIIIFIFFLEDSFC
jgi:hypothetical protein